METKMIIGIDHGNRNMKTANTVFSAAIQPLQARPDSLEHILEYQNQFYYVGGKVPEKECVDKTENENYYPCSTGAGNALPGTDRRFRKNGSCPSA